MRRPVRRALDVGTGNGVQALLCARHSEHVVATDVNERALKFAAFNAALNGSDNVEFRAGSFLEPVEGERFDLVVANPPYVISPESAFMFRDSGLGGDRVSEQLVRNVPSVLEEGAFATVMVSWIQTSSDPVAPPQAWLDGCGCDAWVLHSSTDDPLSTAAAWNRDAPPEEYDERVARWVEYYRREGIEAIGYGAIVMRRRSGDNWVRATQLPPGRLSRASEHLERMFAAAELLSAADDNLLARRFRLTGDARYEEAARPSADGWEPVHRMLSLEGGIGFQASLDGISAELVRDLGGGTLAETLTALARRHVLAVPEAEANGVALIRRMLELGYVVPME